VKKENIRIFNALLYDNYIPHNANDLKEHPMKEIAPKQYLELLLLFIKVLADRLTTHSPRIDHQVQLKD
jgi:hypothetical protein